MPAPINTLLIDGSFEELAEELATYIDDIKKKQGDEASNLHGDLGPILQAGKKDDALKKLVTASPTLNLAPEKGMLVFILRLSDLRQCRDRRCIQPPHPLGQPIRKHRTISAQDMQ